MNKEFKPEVGDIIYAPHHCTFVNEEVNVTRIGDYNEELDAFSISFETLGGAVCNHYLGRESYKLVNPIKKETITMSNVFDNPNQAIKDLSVDADTRLLRKYGFENNNGEVMSIGTTEIVRRVYQASRAEIAADLRKAVAASKTDAEITPEK